MEDNNVQGIQNKSRFSASRVCPVRVRRLQKLCQELSLDALLLVAGLDSKHNLGAHQALTFVFQSHSPWTPEDTPKLPTYLEDLVLILTPNEVRVWSPGESLQVVFEALGQLQGTTQVYGTVNGDEEDDDVVEDCKIGAFVQMMGDLEAVGVPYHGDGEAMTGVESWPLVQAYGLDGVGKSGFFTQNFMVVNVLAEVQQAYTTWDESSVHQLLATNLPCFTRHWGDMLDVMDRQPVQERAKLLIKDICEPLLFYIEHCDVHPGNIRGRKEGHKPRIAFGEASSMKEKKVDEIVGSATIGGDPSAAHFICEAADSKTGIAASRSYFLSHAGLENHILPDENHWKYVEEYGGEKSLLQTISHSMMLIYKAMADVEQELVKEASLKILGPYGLDNQAESILVASAKESFNSLISNTKLPLDTGDLDLEVLFTHLGRSSEAIDIFVIRFCIPEVRLRSKDEGIWKVVGGLVLANTFMQVQSGSHKAPRVIELVKITEHIPVFRCFAVHEPESSVISQAQRSLKGVLEMVRPSTENTPQIVGFNSSSHPLGLTYHEKAIMGTQIGLGEEPCIIYTGSSLAPVLQGSVYFFSGGLVFLSTSIPPFILDFEIQVQGITLHDMMDVSTTRSEYPEIGSIITFDGYAACCSLSPLLTLSTDTRLGLPLRSLPKPARRHFFQNVLPKWREVCSEKGIQFERLKSGVPVFSTDLYPFHWMALETEKKYPVVMEDQILKKSLSLAQDLQISRMWEQGSTRDDAQPVESQSEDVVNGMMVTLITGPPGSGQFELAEAMVGAHTGEKAPWIPAILIEDGASREDDINVHKLDEVLDNAISKSRLDADGSSHSSQILLVMPSTSCSRAIADAVKRTKNVQKKACSLVTMITCVNVDVWMGMRWDGLQDLVGQSDSQYTNQVLLSGKRSREVQQILRLHHPDVHIFACKSHPLDIPLPISHFVPTRSDATLWASARRKYQRYLGPSVKGWWSKFETCRITFTGALESHQLREGLESMGLQVDPQFGHQPPYSFIDPGEIDEKKSYLHAVSGYFCPIDDTIEKQTCFVHGLHKFGVQCKGFQHLGSHMGAHGRHEHHLRSQASGQMTIWGRNMSSLQKELQRLLKSCQPTAPACKPLRQVSSLTEDERQTLQAAHKNDALPAGWFYSQGAYIDAFGDRQHLHPNLDIHINEYIEQDNQHVHKANASCAERFARVPKLKIEKIEIF